jgi:hypothetical protein
MKPVTPHLLDLKAPVGTYEIDGLVPADKVIVTRWVFTLAFLQAHNFHIVDTKYRKSLKAAIARAERLFADVASLRDRLKEPFFNRHVNDRLAVMPTDRRQWKSPEHIDQHFAELRAACDRFLASLHIPSELRPAVGHQDRLASIFIKELANSEALAPLTPVTRDNHTDFARLVTAGWDDLKLPHYYDTDHCDSLYEWIYNRVRKHRDLKSRISPPKNP